MDSEDKKVSLDELPDEGSSFVLETPKISPEKLEEDPRKKRIQKTTDEVAKVRMLQEVWRFDKPEFLFGWAIYIMALAAAQFFIGQSSFREQWRSLNQLANGGLELLGDIISHPIVFILATPFLFRLKKTSDVYFEVNFSGISCIKDLTPRRNEGFTRILIKWPEITNVQKTKNATRDILQLYAKDGPIGVMIWDIDRNKKLGVKRLVSSLVISTHPLRKFLEKDLA